MLNCGFPFFFCRSQRPTATSPPLSAAAASAAVMASYSPASPPLSPSTSAPQAVAGFDFVGQKKGDLSLKKGDSVTILERSVNGDRGWWRGRLLSSGAEGVFPSNYVTESNPSQTGKVPPPRPIRDPSKRLSGAEGSSSNGQSIPLKIPVRSAPSEPAASNPFLALPEQLPGVPARPHTVIAKPTPTQSAAAGSAVIGVLSGLSLPQLPMRRGPAVEVVPDTEPFQVGSLTFSEEELRAVDDFAREVPESVCKDIQSLTLHLIQSCQTVIEQYR